MNGDPRLIHVYSVYEIHDGQYTRMSKRADEGLSGARAKVRMTGTHYAEIR
jgi:hypothetical protein